ncbi:MAG: molybdopterin-guanine dinucleotide biosynthesis protein A [Alphaproteobacteria bacterium]|nr:molybdopterin-guanine dinucleotide biosynthesis protein A [Alphaproteobacteria bacterium]
MKFWVAGLAALALVLTSGPAHADDRHAGYYYPPPGAVEVYTARAQTLPDSTRLRRIGFVVGFTQDLLDNAYPPQFAIFAKGEEAQKLIIVSLQEDSLNTLYRMRGLLAMMTATARASELFQRFQVVEILTFLDLLKMLGFDQVTVTDGRDFAHQIVIE